MSASAAHSRDSSIHNSFFDLIQTRAFHESSLRVLAQVGLVIHHSLARELLLAAGARYDSTRERFFLSEALISAALEHFPRQVVLAGQEAQDDLVLKVGGPTYVRPAIGMDAWLDPETKQRRPANLVDLKMWVQLVEALDGLHVTAPIYAHDTPDAMRDLLAVEACLHWSRKPLTICADSAVSLDWMAELVSSLPRSLAPRILVVVSANSPLTLSKVQCDLLFRAARHGFPILLNSAALAGATAPVNLAGVLTQMNAEVLALLTLLQIAHPGASCIYDVQPLIFDMRAGSAAFGYVELGLLSAACIALGRSYGLPTESSGLKSDAHWVDAQAGFEKAATSCFSFVAGANLISGAGSLSSASTASPLQLVLDNDYALQLLRLSYAARLSPDPTAEEAIERVGPGGNYLIDPHTLAQFRTTVHYSPFAVRATPDSWFTSDKLGATDLAKENMEFLSKQPIEPSLPPSVIAELRRVIQEAQRELVVEN